MTSFVKLFKREFFFFCFYDQRRTTLLEIRVSGSVARIATHTRGASDAMREMTTSEIDVASRIRSTARCSTETCHTRAKYIRDSIRRDDRTTSGYTHERATCVVSGYDVNVRYLRFVRYLKNTVENIDVQTLRAPAHFTQRKWRVMKSRV